MTSFVCSLFIRVLFSKSCMTVRALRPLIASSLSFHKAVRDRLSVETIENDNDKVTSYRFFKEALRNNITKIVSVFILQELEL